MDSRKIVRALTNATATAVAGAAHTTMTTSAKTKKVKKIDYVRTTTGYWHWYIVAGIVGALTLVNIARLILAYWQRRKALARDSRQEVGQKSAPRRIWDAVEVGRKNLFYVRSFPVALYKGTNVSEVFFSLAYLGVCLGLTLYKTYQQGSREIHLQFGMMAQVQIPLIIGLASRNNTISYLTGISYQNLNYLHRAAGRICYLFSWIHTIAYCVFGLGKHGPGNRVFTYGVTALVAFTVVVLSSFALARRVMYETFLVLHIVFVLLFLIGLWFHRPKADLQVWIIAGFVIWGFDRFVGLARMVVINKAWLMPFRKYNRECSECTVELITEDIVRVSVPRPLLRWGPGQHALITMPSVASLRYEQHPFSFANVPLKDGTAPAVFIIRAHDGFTRKLVNHLHEEKSTSIPCYLDGPYGISHSYTHHDSVLLIAGGTGITHVLSIFLSVLAAHREGRSAVRSLRLVWNIRHIRDINWITPLLNEAIIDIPSGIEVVIDVHLTRSKASDEPDMPEGLTQILARQISHQPVDSAPESRDPEKAGSEVGSAEGSGGSSTVGSSRRESGENKEKRGMNEKETGLELKLSEQVASLTTFRAGRADLRGVMEEQVKKCQTTMGVSVCGPELLSLDTRKAVREVNTAKMVYAGQAPIELSVEKFGW